VTIFARRQEPLDAAKKELLSARKNENQEINAISLDLAEASEARIQNPNSPLCIIPDLIRLTLSSDLSLALPIFCTAQPVDVGLNAVS
jgi:hypothetical protein